MKYSIILPYYKRPELRQTLASFVQHYVDRDDYEVIIVEDSKNALDSVSHYELLEIVSQFGSQIKIWCFIDEKESFSPCHKYNLGVSKAGGKFIVLSSPEVVHMSDILGGFDALVAQDPKSYIVCACKAMNADKFYMWYQHSLMRNVLFHFCSVISKENYEKVGGFDERYCAGIGFDDEDLVLRLITNGIKIIPRDDLMTVHIEHSREYIDNHRELVEINRNLYLNQCGV